jgi:hypothetical protein
LIRSRKERRKNKSKRTATAVPGKKSIVRMAIVRMAALSRLVASAIWCALLAISRFACPMAREMAWSRWTTRLNI